MAKRRPKHCAAVALVAAMFFVYVAGYLWFSSVHYGAFGGSRITIRLFDSEWEMRFWKPLIEAEKMLRSEEFYGQVRAGATLPPPRNRKNQ